MEEINTNFNDCLDDLENSIYKTIVIDGCTETIQSTDEVNLYATDYIDINGTFSVNLGAVFQAEVGVGSHTQDQFDVR